MKNPATLPTPDIRAAQALPEACLEEGSVSTRRARSTAITNTNLRRENHVKYRPTMLTDVDRKVN